MGFDALVIGLFWEDGVPYFVGFWLNELFRLNLGVIMRFRETKFCSIDDLYLDEDNYRFGFAKDQQECINLIYNDSPTNFQNLLEDLVANNIGDYPLVYESNNKKVVYDGNRRVSALKVINNPDLAPNATIKELALNINKKKLPFDLKKIGCFVSDNKKDILNTVYERHAAGQGVSRIHWSSFATSKFRYDKKIEDNDWRATAILLFLSNIDNEVQEIIKSPVFFFETFKRLIRHAYSNGYLHFDIFNEDNNTLNIESKHFELSLVLVKKLLENIQKQQVGLSRGKNYASKEFLAEFFNHHYEKATTEKPPKKIKKISKAPDIPTQEKIKPIAVLLKNTPLKGEGDSFTLSSESESNIPKNPVLKKSSYSKRITKNPELIDAINKLNINKFNEIYRSLLKIDPIEHPLLTVVGIWSFLDSLARNIHPSMSSDFSAFFNSKLKIEIKEDKKLIVKLFEFFLHEGNFSKHNGTYSTLNGVDISEKFNIIQPYIAHVIMEHLNKKSCAN